MGYQNLQLYSNVWLPFCLLHLIPWGYRKWIRSITSVSVSVKIVNFFQLKLSINVLHPVDDFCFACLFHILLSTLTSVASDLFNYALRLDNELSVWPPRGCPGLTGDPLHSRALAHSRAPLFTQPCPHCSHSRAPGEQWARLCVFTLQGCVQAARLCRGSPVGLWTRLKTHMSCLQIVWWNQ